MDLFAGTAAAYRRYRSGVPDEVAELLARAAPRRFPRRLLDLGTGTGFVVRAMLPHVDEVVAVDVDADLLAVAEEDLRPLAGTTPLTFLLGRAEEVRPPAGWQASLVTVCRTFHWLDRPAVLRHLEDLVVDDGVVAVFGDRSAWTSDNPWAREAKQVVTEFLGPDRRAGSGTYQRPARGYLDDLADSAFSAVERVEVPVRRERDLDGVVGYLHSTSFAAAHLFGDRLAAFDDEVRRRLAPLAVDGRFVDDNAFDVLLARRPG
ncbi:methyltransferase domain-containing protein [Microlunatus capsulatus]|uniref:SAM-dependent methyltransferase n=1 Tax=Microlunatus capsulatus TaxID=99117 RepID=A0ABS4ZAI5_9ACTN|nr:methyltransferase domain-containing protein [Microlunatus capsulatus]MBP2418066.1 SAM-dependent methyltransferase [Microlunatus capsulatus]